jgi:hypothetical protein
VLRGFNMSENSKNVALNDNVPPEIASWVSFGQKQVTVDAGKTQKLQVIYHIPQAAGFSYSFVIMLEPEQRSQPMSGSTVRGSIAVFNLINVDKPGATEKLNLISFSSDQNTYEFLPATFSATIANSGNTIAKPSGNIFIQKSANSKESIATLPLNAENGHILPGHNRTFTSTWDAGFPKFAIAKASADSKPKRSLQWNWSEFNHIQFGHYVAKAVVLYNNGQRDTTLTATHDFWVIPWRLLGILAVVGILLLIGLVSIIFLIVRLVRKIRARNV